MRAGSRRIGPALRVVLALGVSAGLGCGVSLGGVDGGDPPGLPAPEDVGGSAGVDPTADLLEAGELLRIDIHLPEISLLSLEDDPFEWVPGAVGFRGEYVRDVAVRLKGNTSFRTLDQKAAFRLSFDHYAQDRGFHGLEGLALNNLASDPTFLREAVVAPLYRAAGVPASRTSFAEVYVNNELYGLYVVVEPLDDPFIRRWFADDGGNLYEPMRGVDLWSFAAGLFELQEAGEPEDRADLYRLIEVIETVPDPVFHGAVAEVLDLGAFVSLAAVEAWAGQWDGYAFNANNYALYSGPESGRFTVLPWSPDAAFSRDVDPFAPRGVLGVRCVASPECLEEYRDRLGEVGALWADLDLPSRVEAAYALVRDAVARDPRREWDLEEFEAAVADLRAFVAGRPAAMEAALGARRTDR
ncbi:CotH kinase family protein [Myxococcota bacterium]|nr:CotH kinase family protein [Myxococcota bacterium]